MAHETATVQTEYGPITVNRRTLMNWNTFGWPTDAVLKEMAANQAAGRGVPGGGDDAA